LALSLYVIGAPACGKSSVFDALTNTPQGPQSSSKGDHRLGTVKVPDERLENLREMYQPKKFNPAEVTFFDVGRPPGAQDQRNVGELVTFLGDADAFLLVVQAFGEFDYEGNELNSAKQLDMMFDELVFADLEKVERRLERIEQDKNKGNRGFEQEGAVLEKCKALLEDEQPLTRLELNAEEDKLIRGFRFLSQKPVLVVINVDEGNLGQSDWPEIKTICDNYGHDTITFCAPLEAEIALLEAEEQSGFLADYGLEATAKNRLVRSAYHLLNLVSFFTVGEDEVRAWTIERNTPAQTAAGKIHSDIERGFIRAETIGYDHLIEAGSWSKCRDLGTMRLEGKTYEVADGDVINFRHNT
jgi:hypothetical protein